MSYLLDAITIGLLIIIALELYLLRRDFLWVNRSSGDEVDAGVGKGQTINVNVGSPLPAERAVAVAEVPSLPSDGAEAQPAQETEEERAVREAEAERLAQEEAERVEAEERERRAEERARIAALTSVRATPSGLIVKKCPGCGMENSSYRTECFNCGLHL